MSGDKLNEISPKRHEMFSPNLYQFVRKQTSGRVVNLSVYRDRNGCRWIGYFGDSGWFIGTRLMEALCQGRHAKTGAWVGFTKTNLIEEKRFWKRYTQRGRCEIDPGHTQYFLNAKSRFVERDATRTCQWCGQRQVKVIKRRVVVDELWENAK